MGRFRRDPCLALLGCQRSIYRTQDATKYRCQKLERAIRKQQRPLLQVGALLREHRATIGLDGASSKGHPCSEKQDVNGSITAKNTTIMQLEL